MRSAPLLAVLVLLAGSGCQTADVRSPLTGLEHASLVRLSVPCFPSGRADTSTVTDVATIRELAEVAEEHGDWATTWHTQPAGLVRAAFFRDTIYLGVLSLGEGWVGARAPQGGARFRSMKAGEQEVLAARQKQSNRGSSCHLRTSRR
jgi:hypothetical protein